jgi:hypothetical protein
MFNTSQANIGLVKYDKGAKRDLTVEQLDRKGNMIYRYMLYGCYPKEVSEIALGSDQNDAVEEFTVTFAVDYVLSYNCVGIVTGDNVPNNTPCQKLRDLKADIAKQDAEVKEETMGFAEFIYTGEIFNWI